MGHVAGNFDKDEIMGGLRGRTACGHVRYSTTGETSLRNVQPLYAELATGGFAVSHNGNISNAFRLPNDLVQRGATFQSLCQSAGFDSVSSNAIQTALWEKFVLLATNSSVVALTRLPFGKLRDDPEVFAWFEKGVAEVAAVGRARGVHLPAELEARLLQSTRGFPPEMMPSMAVDLLRGNRLELPWLAGKVVALGRELGVPTPTFAVMYAALKPYANGAPDL